MRSGGARKCAEVTLIRNVIKSRKSKAAQERVHSKSFATSSPQATFQKFDPRYLGYVGGGAPQGDLAVTSSQSNIYRDVVKVGGVTNPSRVTGEASQRIRGLARRLCRMGGIANSKSIKQVFPAQVPH